MGMGIGTDVVGTWWVQGQVLWGWGGDRDRSCGDSCGWGQITVPLQLSTADLLIAAHWFVFPYDSLSLYF